MPYVLNTHYRNQLEFDYGNRFSKLSRAFQPLTVRLGDSLSEVFFPWVIVSVEFWGLQLLLLEILYPRIRLNTSCSGYHPPYFFTDLLLANGIPQFQKD